MSSNQTLNIRNKEFALIGMLLILVAGLAAFFPNLGANSNGDVDWISIPLVGFPILTSAIMLAFASQESRKRKQLIAGPIRLATLAFSLIPLGISTALFFDWLIAVNWEVGYNEYALESQYVWIETIGASWHVGMDGLSFPMVWLTTFLIPVTIVTTWNEKNGATYHPLLLMMGGALIGVFVSLDLFMFYIFWELTLIPMFFLILKWGGTDRRYAAQKFFIYTFTASVIMLLGLITLYFLQPEGNGTYYGSITGRTFDMSKLFSNALAYNLGDGVFLGMDMQKLLFVLLMIGFLVKLPAVPFHTWLPDAHVQAPTGGSMLLAGVMLKMGAYGMLRIPIAIFPDALMYYQDWIMAIGLISLVWGAVVCLGQTNLKRMVAYSSVSHMGVILLGIASMQPLGYAAALFMMFAHGIISPMLFAVCGAFKHHYHSMEIGDMRGMAKFSPYLAVYMMFSWMASLGLPLLAGFVAELMLLLAYWPVYGWWILFPGAVIAITGAYYLWSMQRTIFEGGEHGQPPKSLHGEVPPDITLPENIGMIILAIFTVIFGIFPFIILGMMDQWTVELFEGVFNRGGI
ncbi:MAG: NAD(P)H-quinone oxidoreductase chain 4 1 [Methanobacteriota archaeon]|jgi:proton-translocating NADH-quinone oxidoreductase chain M|nr:MAG: NAD(P)H-quinone oxidoreductase chain 4 1 [Euryarchaeota archaeon]|tara:strand:+ start:119 stop:1837 length:1719 start_codon:yes stop_codon:yes gene_type:complete